VTVVVLFGVNIHDTVAILEDIVEVMFRLVTIQPTTRDRVGAPGVRLNCACL